LNRTQAKDGELDPDSRPMSSRQLTELLSRALLDEELRDRLFAAPDAIAREFNLSGAEAEAIKRLDRRKFEQIVARLRSA
jgi:hypothetical protein